MLRKYSNSRTLEDNMKLGALTAFTAGTINIASLLIFLNFTSNITGHYAIFASEASQGNWSQMGVVGGWIFLFFFGSFLSNFIIINISTRKQYLAHALPIILEIMCMLFIGYYGQFHYKETLVEMQFLVAIMLFATGLQNGLTASISNFAVKTTHLTGTTTDLGILTSMFTKNKYRKNPALIGKAKLLTTIAAAYVAGAIFSGLSYYQLEFKVFYVISACLLVVVGYDLYKIHIRHFKTQYRYYKIHNKTTLITVLYAKIHTNDKEEKEKLTNGRGITFVED